MGELAYERERTIPAMRGTSSLSRVLVGCFGLGFEVSVVDLGMSERSKTLLLDNERAYFNARVRVRELHDFNPASCSTRFRCGLVL